MLSNNKYEISLSTIIGTYFRISHCVTHQIFSNFVELECCFYSNENNFDYQHEHMKLKNDFPFSNARCSNWYVRMHKRYFPSTW